jgi:hypothetical protein
MEIPRRCFRRRTFFAASRASASGSIPEWSCRKLRRPCKELRAGFLVKRNCPGRKHVRYRIRTYPYTTCSEKILIGPEPRETMPYWFRSTRILTFLGESISPLPSPGKVRQARVSQPSVPSEILIDLLRRLNGGVKSWGSFGRTACQQT